MFNVIDINEYRGKQSSGTYDAERAYLRKITVGLKAGGDIRLDLEEIEAIGMHTGNEDIRRNCEAVLADFVGWRGH